MPTRKPPAYDPKPHPRDLLASHDWFMRQLPEGITPLYVGRDRSEVAFELAQQRYDNWQRERSHFVDKIMLAAVALSMLAALLVCHAS